MSPTSAEHVARSLAGQIGLVLDGGASEAGIESTIVALRDSGWEILRPGPITESAIADVLGEQAADSNSGSGIEAPGQLASHYAPGKPVRLAARVAKGDEFHIGFADVLGDWNLSPTGDLAEAAAGLYAALHLAAVSEHPKIAVAPIPESGIGAAINDRLRRAAAEP